MNAPNRNTLAYANHPAADLFPMMDAAAHEELKADIAKHGQRRPVIFIGNQVLDGRNRLKACNELGIEPKREEAPADVDPFEFVLSLNLHRRHLTESQRAMVAAKLAKLRVGDNQHTKEGGQICPPSNEQAAEQLHVSPRSVKTAKQVINRGSDDLS